MHGSEQAGRTTAPIGPDARPDTEAVGQGRTRLRDVDGILLLLCSVPLVLFLGLPLAAILLRIEPAQFLESFANRQVVQAIALSFRTTLMSLAVALLAGTPLAYLLARRRFGGRGLLDTLVDLPMVLPPSVAGVALLLAFGRRGLVGQALDEMGIALSFTEAAVILAQVFVAAPYYVRAATTSFAAIDPELEQAAALDGAGRWQVFRLITAPLAATGLVGGAVMTWARALGEFGATIIFAGNFPGRTQTMPLAIYLGFELDLTIALTLSAILLVVSFLVLFVVKGVLRRRVSAL